MSDGLSSDEWNFQTLMVVQALVGAISANFRMVTLCYENDEWVLNFYVEKNIDKYIEEIDDVFFQFTAYQNGPLPCRYKVITGKQELPGLSDIGTVVFRMRED